MIDVSVVVNSTEMAQDFTILRSTGVWNEGTWVSTTTNVQSFGVITDASPQDIVMQPEGDVIRGERAFYSQQPIYQTSEEIGRSSDILVWDGIKWRVLSVVLNQDYGYYKAVAMRLKAAS